MKVVFTVITNNYDTLKEPAVITEGWRYVCFSDRFYESDVWECYITNKSQRFIKIRGYREMLGRSTSGTCIYIDGSFEIIGDLNKFVKEVPTWFSMRSHPFRDCTFKEAQAVINLKGMHPGLVNQQMERYKDMPECWGLVETGVIVRDIANKDVRKICLKWWSEFKRGVPRDQITVMPAFYRLGMRPHFIPGKVVRKYFKNHDHIKR